MKEILIALMVVAVFVACIVAFTLLLLKKLGVIEYLQVHGDKYISQMAQCDFCLSFWTSLLFVFVIVAITDDTSYTTIPLVSTPIARLMLL